MGKNQKQSGAGVHVLKNPTPLGYSTFVVRCLLFLWLKHGNTELEEAGELNV